jgi:hypothetical protein
VGFVTAAADSGRRASGREPPAGPSGEREPTVDRENLTGHPGGRRIGEVADRVGDLLGLTAAAEWNPAGLARFHLRDLFLAQPGGEQCFRLGRPGATALTRTRWGASSSAQLRVSDSSAAFDAP